MKTSILISSIATFFLMITLGGVPSQKEMESSSQNSADFSGIYTSNMLSHTTTTASVGDRSEPAIINLSSVKEQNLSYLKFDVAEYIENEESSNEGSIELPVAENDLSYLKFDVSNYVEEDFSYLKFDVSEYIADNSITSMDLIEMPNTNLDYLKFDVNDYLINLNSETIQMPEENLHN
jgi:hypothetical protein